MATQSKTTFAGAVDFTGTTHAGLRVQNLTTTQRDALTPAAGMLIYNTSNIRFEKYENGAWVTTSSSTVGKFYTTVGTSGADYITDGVADQTEINAAITATNTAGGGVVHLKTGTYTITDSITMLSNVILEGEGVPSLIKVGGTGCHAIMATSQNDIMIRNLQVDGSKGDAAVTADCHNLRIQGCTNVKLIDIRVKDAIHHNITTNTCVNLVADRIHSTGGGNPSKIANADGTGIILGPDGINLKLTNSTFYDSSYHGVQVYNRCRGVFINNCHITNTGQRTDTGNGLQIHPGNQDVHISNCYVSPNPILGTASASGIRFETVTGEQINGVCIENCTVENCAFAGIRIDGGSDVTIRGCNIRNNGTLATSGNDYGIRVNDGTGGTVSKHVIIIGNNIYDNQVSPTQARPIGLVGAGTDKVNIIGNNMYGHQASNQIFLDPTFVGSYYLSGNFEG